MIGKNLQEKIITETILKLEKLKEEANKLKETGASYEEQRALEKKVMGLARSDISDKSIKQQQQTLIAEILDILISIKSSANPDSASLIEMPKKKNRYALGQEIADQGRVNQESIAGDDGTVTAVSEIDNEEGEALNFMRPGTFSIWDNREDNVSASHNSDKGEISLASTQNKQQRQPRRTYSRTKTKSNLYSQSKLPENRTKRPVMRTPDSIENSFENAVQAITYPLGADFQKSYIECFIKAGGDINFKDKEGKTLLHYTSAKLETTVVSHILLKDKIDPNSRDKHGQTPLHTAFSFLPYSEDRIKTAFSIIEALLINGADLCIRSCYAETPIEAFHHQNEAAYARLKAGKEEPFLKRMLDSPLLTVYNIIEEARPKMMISSEEKIIRANKLRKGYDESSKQIGVKEFLPTDSKNIWLITKYCQEKELSSEEIEQYKEIVIKFVNEPEMTIEDIEKLLLQAASTSLQQPSATQVRSRNQRK